MSTCAFDCKDVCAGAVGDSCGGPWDLKGKCASNLKCDNDDYNEGGKCVENAEFCKETRREMQRLKEEEARAKRERGKQRERESKAKKETLKAYRIYTDAKKRGNQLNEKAKKLAKQQSSLEYSLSGCKNDNKACCRERWRTCVRADGSKYKCRPWKKPAYEKACVDKDGKTRKAGETWGEGGCDCWVWGCRKDCPEFDCTCGKVDKCTAEQEDPNLWKKPLSPK